MDKSFNFKSIKKEFAARIQPKEYVQKTDKDTFVKYGEYNDFPNHLQHLYNNSSIHATCVNAIIDGIVGEGLVAEPSFVLEKANPKESWNAVYRKLATDFKLYGGYAFEVIYNRDQTKMRCYCLSMNL